ncbi:MAG: hypothetical protein AAFO69_17290, partial [Bacteroidota bacterium]
LYTLMVMIEVRLYGKETFWRNGGKSSPNAVTETKPLNNPGFIKITGNRNYVRFRQSGSTRIELLSLEGNILSKLPIEQQGDTVSIDLSSFNPKIHYQLFFYLPEKEQLSIQAHEAYFKMNEIKLDRLHINQRGGRGVISDDSKIAKIILTASDTAKFEIDQAYVDQISVNLNNSTFSVLTKAEELTGSMVNKSVLVAQNPKKLKYERDDSSVIRIIQ